MGRIFENLLPELPKVMNIRICCSKLGIFFFKSKNPPDIIRFLYISIFTFYDFLLMFHDNIDFILFIFCSPKLQFTHIFSPFEEFCKYKILKENAKFTRRKVKTTDKYISTPRIIKIQLWRTRKFFEFIMKKWDNLKANIYFFEY